MRRRTFWNLLKRIVACAFILLSACHLMTSTYHLPITKLLIANRAEIAVRLIRACRELGIQSVAVYSEADANALHVREADQAILIGPPAPKDSYLNAAKIIEAAHTAGAQAIHPGYGFLSENADFAQAVLDAGLIWVGPTPLAMRQMGSKTAARALMQQAGVPIVPGYQSPPSPIGALPDGRGDGGEGFIQAASSLGYPLLIKASGGGGGRGMRIVRDPADLPAALASARAEALSAFGDDTVFLEKYIENSRHIEFQILGDAHGNVVHLFERECSIQRRHQKIIEESPSPLFAAHPDLRKRMAHAAVTAARAVNYQNAGTIEFIVNPDDLTFYFLEMNTRLQVEHPVTEAVTGLDLVHLQLRIAQGESIANLQSQISTRGHALEARLYAEDPANNFYPSIGQLLLVHEPRAPGLRIDSGFTTGDEVTPHYDAMLAKIIAHAPTRAEAIRRLDTALARYIVLGLTTNLPFLRAVIAHPDFLDGTMTTHFIVKNFSEWRPPSVDPDPAAFIAAALADLLPRDSSPPAASPETPRVLPGPWQKTDSFKVGKL